MLMAHMLLTIALLRAQTAAVQPASRKHAINFTFNYDFTTSPACSRKVTRQCIDHFNIYDISAGMSKKVKLGSIPVPPGAKNFVKSISATTQPLLFESGKHLLAVTAQMADGSESDSSQCTVWVEVP